MSSGAHQTRGFDNRCYNVPMKKRQEATEIAPQRRGFRPNVEDDELIKKLRKKTGLDFSGLIRLALRRLAEAEKV